MIDDKCRYYNIITYNNLLFVCLKKGVCKRIMLWWQPAEAFMEAWSQQNRDKAGGALAAIRPQFIQAQVVSNVLANLR